jgi:hypothetical protein
MPPCNLVLTYYPYSHLLSSYSLVHPASFIMWFNLKLFITMCTT